MRTRFACAAVGFFALAACGGGGGGSLTPHAPAAPQMSSIKIAVTVPAPAHATVRRAYVSPGTQSISVAVDGGSPVNTNLAPDSAACPGTDGYPLNCTITITATDGTHTLTFVTYDQQQASATSAPVGNVLSQASIGNITFASGTTPSIPVTLQGTPATMSVTPVTTNVSIVGSNLYLGPSADSHTLDGELSVVTQDADGAFIVGAGSPQVSVAMSGVPSSHLSATISPVNTAPGLYTLHATDYISALDSPMSLTITATPGTGGGSPLSQAYTFSPSVRVTTVAGTLGVAGSTAAVGSAAMLPLDNYSQQPIIGNLSSGNLAIGNGCGFFTIDSSGSVAFPPALNCSTIPEGTGASPLGNSGTASYIAGYAGSTAQSLGQSNGGIFLAQNSSSNCFLYSADLVSGSETQLTGTASPPPCLTPESAPPAQSQPYASAQLDNYTGPFLDVTGGSSPGVYYFTFSAWNATEIYYLHQISGGNVTIVAQIPYGGGGSSAGTLEAFGGSGATASISLPAAATDGNTIFVHSACALYVLDPVGLSLTQVAGGSSCGDVDGTGNDAEFTCCVSGMAVTPKAVYMIESYSPSSTVAVTELRRYDRATNYVSTIIKTAVPKASPLGRIRHHGTSARSASGPVRSGAAAWVPYNTAVDGYGPVAQLLSAGALQYIPSRNSLWYVDSWDDTVREISLSDAAATVPVTGSRRHH